MSGASAPSRRLRVLGLYRAILRAADTRFADKADERQYIYAEARTLFRRNRHLAEPKAIDAAIFEAESRLKLALHYGIPYPRAYYLSPGATGKSRDVAKPAYMRSYESLPGDRAAPPLHEAPDMREKPQGEGHDEEEDEDEEEKEEKGQGARRHGRLGATRPRRKGR